MVLDALGLELQPVMAYAWVLVIQPITSGRAAGALYSCAATAAESYYSMSCMPKQERVLMVLRDSGPRKVFLHSTKGLLYILPYLDKEPEVYQNHRRHCFFNCFKHSVSKFMITGIQACT